MKTPRLATWTVPSISELLPSQTPPLTPVLDLGSPATRQKGKIIIEVASDSDDDTPTLKAKSVHQSHHRST